MKRELAILHVVICFPLRHSFDYLPPRDWNGEILKPGVRIKVPFAQRTTVGMLLELGSKPRIDITKLKHAIEILDNEPLLSEQLIKLNIWASNYYHYPIGEVMLNNLPKLLRKGKEAKLRKASVDIPTSAEISCIRLNKEQQHAVDVINIGSGFNVFLLDGITDSGKTEVYLRVIEKIINKGQQALVLVPEISLTPQTVTRFWNRFSAHVIAVLHSGLTDRERLNAWLMAKQNLASIIIGTRSAIFVPLPKLGIIILDEEHDLSFEQQSGLRYSARNVAVIRGKLENVPVILGSATPSLESLYNAQRKRYTRLQLPERVGIAIHPSFHVIDMRSQKLVEGIAAKLIQEIKHHLQREGQILLFLNRRGYSPTLLCHNCGFVVGCSRCDVPMTLHQKPHYLHCHHCGATKPVYEKCPKCSSDQLIPLGLGTERVEEAIKDIFPEASLLRIDRDTASRRGSMDKMLSEVRDNKCQILIGTQMLAKGHHFPNVTMVAILNVDNGLLSSDFRAPEHIAQLIIQVAGRAGRAEKSGEVYIQTHNPNHPLLLKLINHGYYDFAVENLIERRNANLPPFTYFALIRAEAKTKTTALNFLEQLRDKIKKSVTTKVKLLGPIPAPMQRKAGYYRAQLLINSKSRSALHVFLDLLVQQVETLKLNRKVRWSLDVDPMDMF
jgi:primosomal protein N' (replication factor Y)